MYINLNKKENTMNKSTKEVANFWFIMILLLATMFATVMYIDVARRLKQAQSDLYIEELKASLPKVFTTPNSHRIALVRTWPGVAKVYYRDDTIDIFPLREDGESLLKITKGEKR